MSERPASIIGGALLIAGCCIGAGMLALPILTGLSGFFPSLLVFLVVWAFMLLTGLLLLEINSWFATRVNLISMAGHTLGRVGRSLSWTLYLFLFYALLVAYISESGSLTSSFLRIGLSLRIPTWAGSLFFVVLFGWVVYLGTRPVDLWNRILMIGFSLGYVGLIALGIKYISPQLLTRSDPSYMIFSIPVLITSFGYHNMIPTLVSYMKGDIKRARKTIVLGSSFALIVYLAWEVVVLGIVPLQGASGIVESLNRDHEASQALTGILGSSSWISLCAQALAFFAILTSFLAQALSLVHFLGDGLRIEREKREHLGLCLLALVPPLVFSLIFPQLFFKALGFAGGFCAVILFGIMPVTMVWIGRYRKHIVSSYQVKGGKPLLVALFIFSCFILFFEISNMLGIGLYHA